MKTRRDFLRQCGGIAGMTALTPFFKASLFAAAVGENNDPAIGQLLSPWTPGTMEFHHIYTGMGESIFHIFPDGTSLLIDAGYLNRINYRWKMETLPNDSRDPGEWIARYITRVNPNRDAVDYMMISHFHSDHMGCCLRNSGKTSGRGEDYYLSGMTRLGETIHFKKGFDRAFPNYTDPLPICSPDVDNYRRFLRWKEREDGMAMEAFDVGRLNQITLLHNADAYRDSFQIRNLFAGGVLWTGREGEVDTEPADFFRTQDGSNENMLSIGLRIDFGPFRYYTGGDFNGNYRDANSQEKNTEETIGPVCGPVDVCKTNHHAYIGSMQSGFVRALRPQVFVADVWDQLDIQPSTMGRMTDRDLYPGNRIVCPTNFPPNKKEEFAGAAWRDSVAEEGGHVVIRVNDGGKFFKVYYVNASDEQMIVKSVYGPFQASEKE